MKTIVEFTQNAWLWVAVAGFMVGLVACAGFCTWLMWLDHRAARRGKV